MSTPYAREWSLPEDAPAVFRRVCDLGTLLRLAPQWDVKSFKMSGPPAAGADFLLDVEFDRSEEAVSFKGEVAVASPGSVLRLDLSAPGTRMRVDVEIADHPMGCRLRFGVATDPPPQADDLREYDLWARSLLNYLAISRSRSPLTRVWKWFIDRWWLTMPQSGKRIVFFVVVGEAFSLVFLIAILVWWKFFSSP
jgi:hypothetical protein